MAGTAERQKDVDGRVEPGRGALRLSRMLTVAPAKAGVEGERLNRGPWVPAFAGMTDNCLTIRNSFRVIL